MSIRFDHTIVPSTDKRASAAYWTAVLGLPEARTEGPFAAVDLANDVTFYFAGWDHEVRPQHYALLVSDAEFEAVLGRLQARGQHWWADPEGQHIDQVNHDDGGSGLYFRDPDDHWLELITVRYGGRPSSV